MDGRQNVQGGALLDGTDLLRNVRMERIPFPGLLLALVVANLVHREAALERAGGATVGRLTSLVYNDDRTG
jgi:hypothetical protein